MLSKIDIVNELGKGINIFPLHAENIKGNSINFTISKNAWTTKSGTIYKEKNKWTLENDSNCHGKKSVKLNASQSAVVSDGKKPLLILLPRSVTIIETSEVIGVDYNIGGTLHAKVGLVAKGVAAIGTMLGPGFCGHLMISLQNITDEVIAIPVGDTFVSLVFHYLNTPTEMKNANVSGHVDKLSELGIQINQQTREYLCADWKSSLDGIREKMNTDENFKKILADRKEKQEEEKSILNWQNFFIVIGYLAVLVTLYVGAIVLDGYAGGDSTRWTDIATNIIVTGVIIPILIWGSQFIKKR